MIEWTAAIALSSLLLLALVVPGTLLLRSLGASGSTALAGGPGLSMVVITAATILLPFLGLPWTLGTAVALLLGTCALGVAPAALRWWRRGAEREAGAPGIPEESEAGADATDPAPGPRRALAGLADPRPLVGLLAVRVREYWPALIGVLAVAVPQTVVLVQAMGRPTAIFQNHDAMFHLNLIAEIEDSGNASLLTSAHAVNGGGYYPNLWHVVAAVLPGAPPTAAFNIVLLMVTTLLTPLGCIVLVRALGGGGTAMALAPFAATVTMWFPGLMLYFHGQTPTALSVALLPFALAAVLEWFGSKTRRGALCAAMAAVAGVGIGHAGAGQILLVVCAVLAVVWSAQLLAHWRSRGWWARLASPLPALAGLLLLAVMGASSTLRFMGTYYRTEVPAGRALLNALTLAPFAEVGTVWHHLVLMLASLVGLGLLIARGQAWDCSSPGGSGPSSCAGPSSSSSTSSPCCPRAGGAPTWGAGGVMRPATAPSWPSWPGSWPPTPWAAWAPGAWRPCDAGADRWRWQGSWCSRSRWAPSATAPWRMTPCGCAGPMTWMT